jgi:hypothetical protein
MARWQYMIALGAAALGFVSGCGGGSKGVAPVPHFTHDGPTLMAAAAGNLEGSSSFRLKMSVVTPAQKDQPSYRLAMSGVWDVPQKSGRMTGTLKGTPATIVSVGETEFVSLTPALKKQTGRSWLGSRGTQTFDAFPDVHRVAAIMRSATNPTVAGQQNGVWQVKAVVDRATAEKRTPDPTFRTVLDRLPAKTVVNVWVANDGRPQRIQLALAGDKAKLAGIVELADFGARPDVQQPTTDQVTFTLPPSAKKAPKKGTAK